MTDGDERTGHDVAPDPGWCIHASAHEFAGFGSVVSLPVHNAQAAASELRSVACTYVPYNVRARARAVVQAETSAAPRRKEYVPVRYVSR